jgi:predicted deacylase
MRVRAEQELATVGDPFGATQSKVLASSAGVVIGRSNLPLAYEGDALFHIAQFEDPKAAEATVEEFQLSHAQEPVGRDP